MPYTSATMTAASAAKNVVESFRDVVQDLLVPELKAVKVSLESVHTEMSYLRTEMKLRDEKMEQLIRHIDERNERSLAGLERKFDDAVEFRERLAAIEARLPRQ